MLITDVRDKATGKAVSAYYKLSVPKGWQRLRRTFVSIANSSFD
jgi:hypothetical protein